MPLALYFRPSFDRSLKKLDAQQIKTVRLILETLELYYSSGCDLEKAKRISSKFFYKKLRTPYYEAGVNAHLRVVIRREDDQCIAMLAGNHNQIRQFLLDV